MRIIGGPVNYNFPKAVLPDHGEKRIKPHSENNDWRPETVEKLRALWAEGLSAAEIGRRLKISKNAIIGKAHRLNLPSRPSPIIRSADHPRAKPKVERLPVSALVTGAIVPIEKIRHAEKPVAPIIRAAPVKTEPCCWPIGEPRDRDFRFCNERIAHGKPYCPRHAAISVGRVYAEAAG